MFIVEHDGFELFEGAVRPRADGRARLKTAAAFPTLLHDSLATFDFGH
jgi:hypothetical protein